MLFEISLPNLLPKIINNILQFLNIYPPRLSGTKPNEIKLWLYKIRFEKISMEINKKFMIN